MGAMELRGRRKSSLPEEEEDRRSSIQTKKCCVGCKTISTPMWRNGPAGPRSLCNACGIRYAKMKRAMAVRNLEKRKGRNHVSAFTRSTITPPTFSSSSFTTTNTSADPTDTSNTAIGGDSGDCGGGGLGPSLKLKLIFLGKRAILQRSSSSSVEREISQRRQEEEEEEQQAAFSLLELSCGSVSA